MFLQNFINFVYGLEGRVLWERGETGGEDGWYGDAGGGKAVRGRGRGQGNFKLNVHARLACYTMNKT